MVERGSFSDVAEEIRMLATVRFTDALSISNDAFSFIFTCWFVLNRFSINFLRPAGKTLFIELLALITPLTIFLEILLDPTSHRLQHPVLLG